MRHHILLQLQPAEQACWRPVVQAYGVAVRADGPADLPERVASRTAALITQWDVADPAVMQRALASVRARHPLLPLAALIGPGDGDALSACARLDVECLPTAAPRPVMHRFVQRALVFGALPDEAVARWSSHVAVTCQLTPREVQLMTLGLAHAPRPRIRQLLGVSESTLKAQVRALLRKTGERSLDGLAKNLLRTALLEARAGQGAHYRAPWTSRFSAEGIFGRRRVASNEAA